MKHTTDTSLAALADIRRDQGRRDTFVLAGLKRYRRDRGADPTGYELLRFLQVERPHYDLNSIRPRLTELEDAGRVVKGDKRRCSVTQKTVYTWAAVSPSPVPVPFAERPPVETPRQMGLL